MKHILFVDDDPKVLEGLQRMLRPLRKQWSMLFANGGAEALALLEKTPVDVVVTDMRMPGMDGATLLKSVQERFPRVTRIVLSGHFEVEAELRAIPVAHLFLGKPCDSEVLRTAIERPSNESTQRVISVVGSLPSPPPSWAALINAESASAMLAEILQAFPPTPQFAKSFQRHSQLAATIAARLPVPSTLHSMAVMAALLHDVGKLVLANRLPEQFELVCATSAVEEELFGVSHADVGAYLLSLWGLPSVAVDAIARHHHPVLEEGAKRGLDINAAVHIAGTLADECLGSQSSCDLKYLASLGVDDQLDGWRLLARTAFSEPCR